MRLLFLLFCVTALAWGQAQVCTEVQVLEKADTHFTIQGTIATAGNFPSWGEFNTTTTLSRRTRKQNNSFGSSTGRWVQYLGVDPSTKYYVDFRSEGTSGPCGPFTCPGITCTDCDNTDHAFFATGGSGLDCDVAGNPPSLTTAAEEGCVVGGAACPPTAPTHAHTDYPAVSINGSSLTVNGGCTNLQAHLDTISAADWSLNHEIIIPAGVECKPHNESLDRYELPCPTGLNPTGSGWKFIRPDTDARLLPPHGNTIDPSFKVWMANIQHNEDDYEFTGQVRGNAESLLRMESGCSPNPTRRWWIENVYFEFPDADEMPYNQTTVTGVSGETITAAGHGLAVGDQAWVSLEGIDNGTYGCQVWSVAGNDFTCIGNSGSLTGTFTAGVVTQAAEIALTSCTNTTPVQCDSTAADHGFRQRESFAITGYVNNVLDMVDPVTTKLLRAGFSGVISGAPDGLYNVHHGISSTSDAADTVTLSTSGLVETCVSSCGTLQPYLHMVIEGVSGCSTCNGAQVISVIDNNTIELVDTVAGGVGTGGRIMGIAGKTNHMLWFGKSSDYGNVGAEEVVLDRDVLDAKPWTRPFFGYVPGNSSSIFGSWFQHFNNECEYNPKTGLVALTACPASMNPGSGSNVIVSTQVSDLFLSGLVLTHNAGINIFLSDDGSTTRQQPINLTLQGSTIFRPRRYVPGHAESDGFFYAHRHLFETKGSEKMAFIGNHWDGNSANSDTVFGMFLLSPRGDSTATFTRYVRDVDFRWNILRDNNAHFTVIEETSGATMYFPTKRVRIKQNLWIMSRYGGTTGGISESTRLTANPALNIGVAQWGVPGPFLTGTADVDISRNTILYAQSNRTNVIGFSFNHSSRVQVEDNIFGYSETSDDLQGCAGGQDAEGILPLPATTTCKVSFDGWTNASSHFKDNVILPVVHNPDSGFDASRASLADASTVTASEATTYFSGLTGITIVGSLSACSPDCPDSALDREELLFQAHSWQPTSPTYDDKGADFDAMADNTRYVGPVTVTDLTATSMQIDYRAPVDAAACRIDYTSDAGFGVNYWTNGGSFLDLDQTPAQPQDRTVTLSGLAADTKYRYRIFCEGARTQILGLLRTAQ